MNENNNNQNRNENDFSQYYPSDETYNENDDVFYRYEKSKAKKSKFSLKNLSVLQWSIISLIAVVVLGLTSGIVWISVSRPTHSSEGPRFPTESTGTNAPPLDNKDPGGDHGFVPIDNVFNILVVGCDATGNLADVTMVVNIHTGTKKMSIMQIPRDTYIYTEDSILRKVTEIYSSYVVGKQKDDRLDALNKYKNLFEKNLCITIEHVVEINLDAFVDIVNTLGGVDVYIPSPMYYEAPDQNLVINIPAGQQHLDGENAMGFVRYRSGYVQADIGRMDAQKIFMTALLQQIKSKYSIKNVGMFASIASTLLKETVTDIPLNWIDDYAAAFLGMDFADVTMMTLPGMWETNTQYYFINREAVLNLVNDYFNIYEKKISDSIFDMNRAFCISGNTAVENIYYGDADSIIGGVYNAEEITQSGIDIPQINPSH